MNSILFVWSMSIGFSCWITPQFSYLSWTFRKVIHFVLWQRINCHGLWTQCKDRIIIIIICLVNYTTLISIKYRGANHDYVLHWVGLHNYCEDYNHQMYDKSAVSVSMTGAFHSRLWNNTGIFHTVQLLGYRPVSQMK